MNVGMDDPENIFGIYIDVLELTIKMSQSENQFHSRSSFQLHIYLEIRIEDRRWGVPLGWSCSRCGGEWLSCE